MLTNTYLQIQQLLPYLTYEERERLVAEIRRMIENADAEPLHDIMEFEGVAKDFWKGIDVQEYLDRERDSWDNGPSYHMSNETDDESDKL